MNRRDIKDLNNSIRCCLLVMRSSKNVIGVVSNLKMKMGSNSINVSMSSY